MSKRSNDLVPELYFPDITYGMPKVLMPKARDFEEEAAKKFLEGLRTQVTLSGAKLKENEQIVMYCWHGHEKLQVLSISMPSHNVVAMHCMDSDGCQTDVTGHIHSTNFSIKVQTIIPPAVRVPIGFEMPRSS